jgi:hypothetical protein
VAIVLVVGMTVWGWLDVRERGQTHPKHADFHRTDFTVYTEAGAAFFDGREPYETTNPRGWYYLYPPMFALLVSPLAALDFKSQVVVWYVISLFLAFGCYSESRRLWTLLAPSDDGDVGVGRNSAFVMGTCASLTVLLPTLECLQRGQVGIALVYPLLLGFRLALGGRSWPVRYVGGIVLAWAIVVKLIPALPVAVFVLQRWAAALAPSRSRWSSRRAAVLTLGLASGVFLFTLAIPAAYVGWTQNLHHLRTWSRKVLTSSDIGRQAFVEVDNDGNQSFSNAAHLLASRVRGDATAGADVSTDPAAHRQWVAAVTAISARRRGDYVTAKWVRGVQVAVLALLIVLGLVTGLRNDLLGQAATYGLACVAIVLVSPVAWTHYYVLWLPSMLFVPLWLVRRGRLRAARAVATVPVGLIWVHYVAKPWLGYFGLLGLSTLLWYLAVVTLSILIRASYTSPRLHGRRTTGSRSRDRKRCGGMSAGGCEESGQTNASTAAGGSF